MPPHCVWLVGHRRGRVDEHLAANRIEMVGPVPPRGPCRACGSVQPPAHKPQTYGHRHRASDLRSARTAQAGPRAHRWNPWHSRLDGAPRAGALGAQSTGMDGSAHGARGAPHPDHPPGRARAHRRQTARPDSGWRGPQDDRAHPRQGPSTPKRWLYPHPLGHRCLLAPGLFGIRRTGEHLSVRGVPRARGGLLCRAWHRHRADPHRQRLRISQHRLGAHMCPAGTHPHPHPALPTGHQRQSRAFQPHALRRDASMSVKWR
jgi:hypothetical protein